jgi:hypothetical protein
MSARQLYLSVPFTRRRLVWNTEQAAIVKKRARYLWEDEDVVTFYDDVRTVNELMSENI